jgi:hypothetical protein
MYGINTLHIQNFLVFLYLNYFNNKINFSIMETLIIESEGAVLEQIKAYLKELKVNFKTKKKKELTVNKELVKLIQEAHEQKERGELITVDPMNIWESIR